MVIFFTKRLLDEKRHLSKIWLAAHWEKKLKRPQVFKIDIEKSVQDIIKTEIILDLRISGHLLVGIVRIHSKKTKYLLTECSSVFCQVKIFHAGRIDLPDNKQTASVNNITLTEYLDDNFNNVINNVVEGLFSTHQSQLEDITLKEASTGRLTLLDDDMMNFEFHEEDEPFEFPNADPTTDLIITDLEAPNTSTHDPERNKATTVYNREGVLNVHADEEERLDKLMGDFLSKDAQDVINEIPESIDLSCLANGDIHDDSNIAAAQANNRILDILELEPIDVSSEEHTKTKSKKRKLCVDYAKRFSEKDIHKQVLDTTDIISVFEMAPNSKRLMTLKDIGSTKKLFRLPSLKMESKKLYKVYERNLKTRPSDDFDSNPEDDDDMSRTHKLRKRSRRESSERPPPVYDSSMSYDNFDDFQGSNTRRRTKISFISTFAIRICGEFTDNGGMDEFNENDDINDTLFVESQLSTQFQSNNGISDLESPPTAKTSQEKWEYALQGRIVQTLDTLKQLLKNKSTIFFSDFAKNNRRLQVAQKFLCLLMLKKFEVITLDQSESYGEIYISRGLDFDTASASLCSD